MEKVISLAKVAMLRVEVLGSNRTLHSDTQTHDCENVNGRWLCGACKKGYVVDVLGCECSNTDCAATLVEIIDKGPLVDKMAKIVSEAPES